MGRKTSILVTVAIFLGIGLFAAGIAWVEFNDKSEENVLKAKMEKNRPKSISLPGESQAVADVANTQAAAAQQASQVQSPPADTPATDEAKTDDTKVDDDKNMPANKSFEDKNLGIGFSYPQEYTIGNSGSQLAATKDDKIQWKLKVYDNKNKKEIKEWFDAYFDKDDNSDCVLGDAATLKFGSLTPKTLKADSTDKKCNDGGYFALNDSKTKVVRVVFGIDLLVAYFSPRDFQKNCRH